MLNLLIKTGVFALAVSVNAAAFQNLGFESFNLSAVGTNGYGPTAQVIPGWRVVDSAFGTRDYVGFNQRLGQFAGQISLFDQSGSSLFDYGPDEGTSEGNYFLAMIQPLSADGFGYFSLLQDGMIPSDSRSLSFYKLSGDFELYINEINIPLIKWGTSLGDGDTDVFAGDVSMFAGSEVELEIRTIVSPGPPGYPAFHALDGIRFSPTAIPEPRSVPLILAFLLQLFFERLGRFSKRWH